MNTQSKQRTSGPAEVFNADFAATRQQSDYFRVWALGEEFTVHESPMRDAPHTSYHIIRNRDGALIERLITIPTVSDARYASARRKGVLLVQSLDPTKHQLSPVKKRAAPFKAYNYDQSAGENKRNTMLAARKRGLETANGRD